MTYTAPDGHVMVINSTENVVYDCPQSGMIEGVFDSLETTYANNIFGIQQIRINRIVDHDSILITIRQSTDLELQEYIDSIVREETAARLAAEMEATLKIDQQGNLN
jgi:hypothetical protein